MEVELSTGVKLEVKAVPAFVIKKIQDGLAGERPKVPKVYLKEDDREIEVPENPDYQHALLAYEGKVVEATYDAMIILGTLATYVPDSIQKASDTEWAEELKLVGVDIPVNGKSRYLAWIKYYVCAQDRDLKKIMDAVNAAIGVTEEEAAKAAEMFRRTTQR